jgi:DNA polymerase
VKSKIHVEAYALTGGKVIKVESDVQKLVEWINAQGVDMSSVDKEAVSAALLDQTLPPKVRSVLELRRAASKGSLGKLDKMLLMRGADGRARGILQYYGAGRTGRWAGRGIQVQNLPRNRSGLDPDHVLETLRVKVEGLELFYEKPLDALSECLRACLTASPGKLLAMVDLSQIEARVVAWLAWQQDILDVFRGGTKDIYVYAANKIGSADRQLGKVVTLACGFQMGAARFQATAYDYGIQMSLVEAERTVESWRKANSQIVGFWHALDKAARACIAAPGSIHTARSARLRVRDGKLLIQKPNKAVLIYHNPRMSDGNIVFDGVINSKQWGTRKLYGGLMTENITQSMARDLIAEALVRIENRLGLVPVMTIHDEVVYEVESEDAGKAIQHEVETLPWWATGLPVASKLNVAFRFGK